MELNRSSQYMKLIEWRHRIMVFNMTCCDTQSQVQSKQNAIHFRYTIMARGYL